jgi:folate-binding protein YgfZ
VSQRTPLYEETARAGAVFAEESGWLVPAHYGDAAGEYQAACVDGALFDCSHHGKIQLTGPDAASFLHNLSTNDITRLAAGTGCEAFLANAKAKVVAHVLIYRAVAEDSSGGLWLDVVPGLTDKVLKHFNHYLISEQVEIVDRSSELAQVHVAGPRARMLLAKGAGELPELAEFQHVRRSIGPGASCQIRRHDPLGVPGYDIICPADQAANVWQVLTGAGARPAGRTAQELLRVEAGTPVYGVDMDENNLVMEVGRTRQAISFTKGCYLGQEPVVRSRDLGHVNRSLLGLKIHSEQVVPRGAKLLRDGSDVGQVTSSVVSPRLGTALALAYVRRGSQDPGTKLEVVTGPDSRTAEIVSLPLAGGGGGVS